MNEDPLIRFKRLNPRTDHDIPLPRYMTDQAAGMDICAAPAQDETLQPGRSALIPTGLAMALPPGFEAQIRPRSGLAIHHGVTVLNAPGTIDSDYRGEIKVALINHGAHPFTVRRGERIAQMVIQRVCQARVQEVERLEETRRDTGGFGSTGVK